MFKNIYRWEKCGLVISPQKELWWMQTHAMIPSPLKIDDKTARIYFSGRDKNNISHIGWALIDLDQPTKVLEYSENPVLSPGARGCFDDNGVTPSCLINDGENIHLYFIGWNPGFNVRMHLFGGLAISKDKGNNFQRYSQAPIIERNKVNPYLNTAPNVIKTGNTWLMYYVSGTEWLHKDLPRYNIQIARSSNGLDWTRHGEVAIDYKNDQEMALARPWVIKDNDGIFKMWFSYKGNVEEGSSYRIGYAESYDGFQWERQDNLSNISTSENSFDSDMIEYSSVIEHKGKKIMFYNGNNYGANGIGVAIEI